MKLVLINGEKIEIHKRNCGYQYFDDKHIAWGRSRWSRNWGIDPVEIVGDGSKQGFFVIGKWGTTGREPCDRLIPVRSVLYIEETDVW
ncbi:hypothetical protein LCGC14_0797480 [marine sediment metagenome]|uniref:Uncharacterized protein n=1 Tax=marine sediment metagenome TaxID=412755 RepID=A0A0F9SAP8_9ZZZZ